MTHNIFDALEQKLSTVNGDYSASRDLYLAQQEGAQQMRLSFLLFSAGSAALFLLLTSLLYTHAVTVREPLVMMVIIVLSTVIVMVMIDIVHDHMIRRPRNLSNARDTAEFYHAQQKALVRYQQGVIDEHGIRMIYLQTPEKTYARNTRLSTVFDWCVYTLLFFGIGLFVLLLFL